MSEPPERDILVPYDFSPEADISLEYAARLADHLKLGICLLNIHDHGTMDFLRENGQDTSYIEPRLESMLHDTLDHHKLANGSVVVSPGKLSQIGRELKKRKSLFTVIGASGRSPLALKIAAMAINPLIIVQGRTEWKPFQNILLPMGFFRVPAAAPQWMVRMSKKYNAKIHLFMLEEYSRFGYDYTRRNLDLLIELFKKEGVDYRVSMSAVETGDPRKILMGYAKEIQADLMIAFKKTSPILPSVSVRSFDKELIFNKDHIPVMVVDPNLKLVE